METSLVNFLHVVPVQVHVMYEFDKQHILPGEKSIIVYAHQFVEFVLRNIVQNKNVIKCT